MRFLPLVLAWALTLPLAAQTAPRPEDVATLDGIMKAYYEVVSGPAGGRPDRARDHTIHVPDARVGLPRQTPDGIRLAMMTLDEYHDRFGQPRSAPFYEVELHRVVQRFGMITHVWSTYGYSDRPGGPIQQRGINSIQCYFDGTRWWILGWVFDSERAGNPIPTEYLPPS
jgi:hypothetical protein